MSTAISPPLSNLQVELLRLYANNVPEEDLLAIKQLINDFFVEKAVHVADRIWDERGYSNDTMEQWLNTDLRKNQPE
ncbi:MAG: hypothetical protein EOP06_10775 [Proteobacteria bacterium]|nr:MAG: hypothetical protein EOP06_10775 [Pseudomonadota bacterium]